jgi:predicted N-formylglutamate amidohydrolase
MMYQARLEPPQVEVCEAVELFNPHGGFPCLLVCDHASSALPENHDGLCADPAHLRTHVGADIGIAPVVRALAVLLDAPAILTRQSRLLIDCNRWIADPSSIPVESDGIAVPGNADLNAEARAERQHRYFWPYHGHIQRFLTEMRTRHSAPLLLALHSFSRQFGGERRDIDAGTFWHYDSRLSDALIAALGREPGLLLASNAPYNGFGGTSFTLDYHSWGTDIAACGFEIVNNAILTPPDQARWTSRLAEALSGIVADQSGMSR